MGLHLSERERRASDAERELVEWKKVRFMASRLGERFSGYVTGTQAFGLFVELEEIYVQGLVHVSSMSDDYYAFDERSHRLRGENTGKIYRLGDRVEVQVARVDLERRQVDFALVDVLERARGSEGEGPRARRGPGRPTRAADEGPGRQARRAGRRWRLGRPGAGQRAAQARTAAPGPGPAAGPLNRSDVRPVTARPATLELSRFHDAANGRSPIVTSGASKLPAPRPSEARMVALNLSARELVFLQKVTRQEYHFITDDEQLARLKLRDKLVEAAFDQERGRVVLNLTRDELLFLIKVARENYSFIARAEKEARLALAAKLHKTAESVFGVTTREE